jgi:hypothetical protein
VGIAFFNQEVILQDAAKSCIKRTSNGFPGLMISAALVVALGIQMCAREKDAVQYGAALIVNVPFPEGEVTQVVQDVVQNGIIRGTKEYSKDEYLSGAEAASASKAFPDWGEGGRVFYKVRFKALDPWNFKDTNDTGTVAVRYVVQNQDASHTVLRIDAKFIEDSRHVSHPSNGSVEGAEYKDIHDRLEAIALMKSQAAEAERSKQYSSSKATEIALEDQPASLPEAAPTTSATGGALEAHTSAANTDPVAELTHPVTLEERVHELRRQVERIVKSSGAALKVAPFHTASTVQTLRAGTEVLIVISTSYWFGVETHDGQHGWVLRDELELVP